MTLPDRFWAKTTTSDCIIWTGAAATNGYGVFYVGDGKYGHAHRLAWIDTNGPIPDGLVVDHLCRVRNCVNVAHMQLVTQRENVRRGSRHRKAAMS